MFRRLTLLLGLLFTSPAFAAVTTVCNWDTYTAGPAIATVSCTAGAAVSSGTLVAVFTADTSVASGHGTVTDSKGNTYTFITSATVNGTPQAAAFYSFVGTALTTSDTITYTSPASASTTTAAIAVAAATGYNALDTATTASASNGFSTTFSVTAAGSASVFNELYFGWVNTFSTPTITASGWTSGTPTSPLTSMIAGYEVNSGSTPLTFSGTLAAGQWAGALIVSFKPTGGGGGGGVIFHGLTTLGVGE